MLREDTKSILIVRLGAMGDIIHSLPGAASLKHSFPNARVSWVVSPQFVPLLEGDWRGQKSLLKAREDR